MHCFIPIRRLHGGLCATYESASLRRFRQGRVDSIRASHCDALAWVRTMDDERVDNNTKSRRHKTFFSFLTDAPDK